MVIGFDAKHAENLILPTIIVIRKERRALRNDDDTLALGAQNRGALPSDYGKVSQC